MDRNVPPTDPTLHPSSETSSEAGVRSAGPARLRQIAAALSIPVEALMPPAVPLNDRARILAENGEALRIFSKLTDPALRERSLAFLRRIAEEGPTR